MAAREVATLEEVGGTWPSFEGKDVMHLRLAADLLFRSWFVLATSIMVAGALQGTDFIRLLEQHPSPRVASSEFGIHECGGFLPTTDVPLIPGETFGWRLTVPDGQPVAWREELVLPAAPAVWSGAGFIDIRDDGRTAVTAGVDVPWQGELSHAWVVTEGDPPGDYELRLWVDGRLHEIYRFRVQ
jgi:hypothetical protein